jgi:hypothetical protein
MMTTKGVHPRGNLSGDVPAGHAVDFTTHISTICIRYQELLTAYYSAANGNTYTHIYFFSLFFSFYFQMLIIFYFTLFITFYSFRFLPPLSNFAALGHCLVWLVAEPVVYTVRISVMWVMCVAVTVLLQFTCGWNTLLRFAYSNKNKYFVLLFGIKIFFI